MHWQYPSSWHWVVRGFTVTLGRVRLHWSLTATLRKSLNCQSVAQPSSSWHWRELNHLARWSRWGSHRDNIRSYLVSFYLENGRYFYSRSQKEEQVDVRVSAQYANYLKLSHIWSHFTLRMRGIFTQGHKRKSRWMGEWAPNMQTISNYLIFGLILPWECEVFLLKVTKGRAGGWESERPICKLSQTISALSSWPPELIEGKKRPSLSFPGRGALLR